MESYYVRGSYSAPPCKERRYKSMFTAFVQAGQEAVTSYWRRIGGMRWRAGSVAAIDVCSSTDAQRETTLDPYWSYCVPR